MYRIVNEYMNKVKLCQDSSIYDRLNQYLNDCETVDGHTVTVSFMRYVVDVRLKKFSVENANDFFAEFNKHISYEYSSLFVRFNEGKCVRYRYITSQENKNAFYCDIVIH